ncbi:MAG TPA: MATE family efflux transporter [Mycobacteriales bacterium]
MTAGTGTRARVRAVVALGLPALAVLAAEPLYVLVDTAVVGHLGRVPLAALALGGTVLSLAAMLGSFLAYGTTGRAARLYGAGRRADAVREGVQASWLAVALGVAFVVVVQLVAHPLLGLLAGGGADSAAVRAAAEQWLRIAVLGAPGILLSLAGNGWMRGVQDTARPLRYVLAGNLLSAVLGPLLVYPVGLGLTGSAVANVAAQAVAAVLFLRALRAEGVSLRPDPHLIRQQLAVGRDLTLRTVSMHACFVSAAAVAARFGAAQLGAHQIALQLWFSLALVLDSVAIAAQSLVGAALGAGRADDARGTAWTVGWLGGALGTLSGALLLAGTHAVPRLFTADAGVLHQAAVVWPWFALMQPVAGVVFALDGVLIGAGDTRFMRDVTLVSTLGGFLPAVWIAYALDLGLVGVWAGLMLFVVIRLVGMTVRVARGRWAVVGA